MSVSACVSASASAMVVMVVVWYLGCHTIHVRELGPLILGAVEHTLAVHVEPLVRVHHDEHLRARGVFYGVLRCGIEERLVLDVILHERQR